MVKVDKLTPTERRLFEKLKTGMPVHVDELLTCLLDDLGDENTLSPHLVSLRRKIGNRGLGVLYGRFPHGKNRGQSYYRLVRFISDT